MSDGKLLQGQKYDEDNNLVVRFTQQMQEIASADLLLGNNKTEIIPQDAAASIVRTYSTPDLTAYYFQTPTTINIQFPDVLTDITSTWSDSKAEGTKSSGPGSFYFVGSGSDAISASASATSGGSYTPDVQPLIKQTWAQNAIASKVLFYLPGNVTNTQILDRLSGIFDATVQAWPIFKPEAITITITAEQCSLQASAEARNAYNVSSAGTGGSTTKGEGYSKDASSTVKTIRIPPTLHDSISITNASRNFTLQAIATASAPAIMSLSGSVIVPAATAGGTPVSQLINAKIEPSSIPATSPKTIPSSGLYVAQIDCKSWKYNLTAVQAIVVDFVQFTTNV